MESPEHSIPVPCCRNLRCKSMFYRADERPGLLHASTTMSYWCHCTNDHLGPDEKPVGHPACQEGRSCHAT